MEKQTDIPETAPAAVDMKMVQELLRSCGQVINSISLYNLDHKVTRQAIDAGFETLNKVLTRYEAINLVVSDNALLVNGQAVELGSTLVAGWVKHLADLKAGGFSILRGITPEEFSRLMKIVATPPDMVKASGNSFPELLKQTAFPHVRSKHITYRQITDDEVVVSKSAAAPETPMDAVKVGQIIAFLKGESAAGAVGDGPEAMGKILSDTDKLSELILKAADIRPETAQVQGGELLGNMVVGCIRRLCRRVSESGAGKSRQAKKELIESLVLLEQSVIEKLRAAAGPADTENAEQEISDAFAEIADALKVDTLVADYIKKRRQTENTEKRLRRYIATHRDRTGDEADLRELREKLLEKGLDADGWDILLTKNTGDTRKNGTGSGTKGGEGTSSPAMALMLIQLTELLDPDKRPPGQPPKEQELAPVVSRLNQGVITALAGTARKADALQEKIKEIHRLPAEASPAEVAQQALSRKEIINILVEIVQELRQPLTVINSAIEIILKSQVGNITTVQKELFDLALASGQRIAKIIDALASISGMSAALHPDADILSFIYQQR